MYLWTNHKTQTRFKGQGPGFARFLKKRKNLLDPRYEMSLFLAQNIVFHIHDLQRFCIFACEGARLYQIT